VTAPQPTNPQRQPAPAKSAAPAPRMALANVTRGKLKRSMRIFLYGVDKIGKSTFGAGAPAPIVIGAEDGTRAGRDALPRAALIPRHPRRP